MDLFVCDLCGAVDAVDLAYADRPRPAHTDDKHPEWLCTCCQSGKWHNLFDKRTYRPEFDLVINRPNGVGLGA